MKWFKRNAAALLGVLSVCAVGAAAAEPAAAKFHPTQPVRVVVAYVPGGATDLIARIMSEKLGKLWNQQVVVENRPGAGGMIGADNVVKAKPDGYTLLLGYTPEVSINKLVYNKMMYDPLADLTAISLVAEAPLVLVSGPKLPVKSFKELLALKGQHRSIAFGSPGTGGQQHLAGELLRVRTGLDMLHVPYKGTGAAVADLVGGQIDVFFATTPPLLGNIRAGKLHPLLVTGPVRQPLLPNTPTVDELGLKDFHLSNWFGVFGPAGMDKQVTAGIAADVAAVLEDPATVKAMEDNGLTIHYLPPDGFRQFIAKEMDLYTGIIAATGVPKQ
ncbi:ABC transporter substrate-binding protein [Bordetella genomosp. 9]|uniref:ABC transporter substrate-binding protein n=1 Tax=Bordetella genomosp. 9 TaxID=1416803 RepID=A0A261R113_9BORD|nr:tripartite tricarboxylate transporter substrate binding protein [Bordetella genomosp. 9]OZI18728.1 ABC transporter substrate-binding protein [Bordetella genomosp. 9]